MNQAITTPKPKKWKSLLCRNNDHYTCGLSYESDSWTTTGYCDCGCHAGNKPSESAEEMLRSFYQRASQGEQNFRISKHNFIEIMRYYKPEITKAEEEEFLKTENSLYGVRVELED